MPDFFEYLYGSDPKDPASSGFQLRAESKGGNATFVWAVKAGFVLGAHYHLEYCTDLSDPEGLADAASGGFSLTPSVANGSTQLRLELTADHGDHVFTRIVQPK